jgi:hypothetical protein
VEVRGVLPGRRALRGHRQHDLIDPRQPASALGHDDRAEASIDIARDVDLDRADLGERRYLQPMTACP